MPVQPGFQTTPSAASNVFNPSTSVIGNFLGASGQNTVNPAPALQMQESEVSFQAVVDPYARADFFMAFGEEGVDLEEGFITFPTLPGGLLVKVGKMRLGVRQGQHPAHPRAAVDRSAARDWRTCSVVKKGSADSGMSVARLIPNPWIFLEATGQVVPRRLGRCLPVAASAAI